MINLCDNGDRLGKVYSSRSLFRVDVLAALGTGIGLGVVSAGRVVTGSRGLIEGGHMVRYG